MLVEAWDDGEAAAKKGECKLAFTLSSVSEMERKVPEGSRETHDHITDCTLV